MKKPREGGAELGMKPALFVKPPLKDGFDHNRDGDGDWIHAYLRT